jgi:hypothetical protein
MKPRLIILYDDVIPKRAVIISAAIYPGNIPVKIKRVKREQIPDNANWYEYRGTWKIRGAVE